MTRRPPQRPSTAVRGELDRALTRLEAMRRDPEFLVSGSGVETEHRRVGRQAAALRAELDAGNGHRDRIQNSGRY